MAHGQAAKDSIFVTPDTPIARRVAPAEIAAHVAAFLARGGEVQIVDGFSEVRPRPVLVPKQIPADERFDSEYLKRNNKPVKRYTVSSASVYLRMPHSTFAEIVEAGLGPRIEETKTNRRGHVTRYYLKADLDDYLRDGSLSR